MQKLLLDVRDMSGGLNVGARPHLIADNEVQDCQNVDFLPGLVSTCQGYSLYDSIASDRIYTFIQRDGTTQKVQQVGDKLYIDGVLKKSSIIGLLSFLTYQGLLFCVNASTTFIWDGTSEQVWGVVKPATTCTATLGAVGNPTEVRQYYVTYVNARGQESNPSAVSNQVDCTGGKQVDLTAIPTGPANVTKRRIYCQTTVGSTTDTWLLTEIANNTATTYTDNTAGSALALGNTVELDNDPPPKGGYILEHKNRVFITSGSVLYWSKLGKPEAFPLVNYITVSDTGDDITGLWVLGNQIVIFKERSIAYLIDSGETSTWNYDVINFNRGCPYPDTIQLIDNNLVWLGYDDLYQLVPKLFPDERSVVPFGERVKSLITGDTAPLSTDFNGRYWVKVGPNLIIYDYRRNHFTRYTFPDGIKGFHVTPDNKLLFGTISGTMQYGVGTSFNGKAINPYVIHKDIDMGARSQRKKLKKVFIYYKTTDTAHKVTIQVGVGSQGYSQPIEIDTDSGYAVWGSGEFGLDAFGGVDSPGQKPLSVSGQENFFRVKMGNSNLDQPFELYGYSVLYKLKPVR